VTLRLIFILNKPKPAPKDGKGRAIRRWELTLNYWIMITYDFILSGSEATLENAIEHAKHQDWQSIETTKNEYLPYLDFKEAINGIEIWYDYSCGIYIFTDIK